MHTLSRAVDRYSTRLTKPAVLSIATFACALAGCNGSAVGIPPGAPAAPSPADPWFGAAGNVLVREPDAKPIYTWIGFNSETNWHQYLAAVQQANEDGGTAIQIGGPVISDPANPLGFYFDPNGTVVAQVTLPIARTSLGYLEQNPACFSTEPMRGFVWFVRVDPVYPDRLLKPDTTYNATPPAYCYLIPID